MVELKPGGFVGETGKANVKIIRIGKFDGPLPPNAVTFKIEKHGDDIRISGSGTITGDIKSEGSISITC